MLGELAVESPPMRYIATKTLSAREVFAWGSYCVHIARLYGVECGPGLKGCERDLNGGSGETRTGAEGE